MCHVVTSTLGAGVGVGVGEGLGTAGICGVGVGVAAGGVLFGGGGVAGFEEAPTLPQPAIARIAAAATKAAGILKRYKNTRIAVTFSVTHVGTDFLGFIDEWLFLKRKGRGNGGRSFASFGAQHSQQKHCLCCCSKRCSSSGQRCTFEKY